MKIIKLYGMVLENFKGIRKLEAKFDGKDIKVYGDNGAGKTTLFDAFLFVLFGKDSKANKNFAIKTIVDGEELHNVDHSVSIDISVNDERINLKRTFKEVYKKGRNAAEKIFNGHKSYFEYNGVPCNEKEFKSKVDELVNEEVFKLITNPMYFNELDWKEQRKILFQLAEGVEFDPISKNKDLELLKELLDKYEFSEALAMYKAKSKKIKNEIETIPTRIDELNKSINEYDQDSQQAEEDLKKVEEEIDSLKDQIKAIENGELITSKKKELESLNDELKVYTSKKQKESILEINKLLTKMEEVQGNGQIIQSKYLAFKYELDALNLKIKEIDNAIKFKENQIENLRDEYKQLKNVLFQKNNYEKQCLSCGKPLLELSEEEAKSLFDKEIKGKKEIINEEGLKIKKEIESLAVDLQELKDLAEHKNDELLKQKVLLDEAKKQKDKLQIKIHELKSKDGSQEDEFVLSKKKEISLKENELFGLQNDASEIVIDLEGSLSVAIHKKNELNKSLSKRYAAIEAQKRIDELNYLLKQLLIDFDDAERYIYLLEQYNREKVENLSQSINDLFYITEFKLFKKLVNGEYEETCESLHNNVPYGKGLNTAARINVGLDIINVLCDKYGVYAPIFVDNAESVSDILETKGQKICMYVKEGQKTLEFKEN